jgi:trehalose synthase
VLEPRGRPQAAAVLRERPLAAVEAARAALRGRTVWHVNSTATGGGIAELLHSAIEWHHEAGLTTRWLVVSGSDDYFEVTKRIHDKLHGHAASALSTRDAVLYREATAAQARAALRLVEPDDVVVLHDPQPLGMAPALIAAGARVIWRSHIGTARWNPEVEEAWRFLGPYLADVPVRVFSSARYVPPGAPPDRTRVVHPSIDPTSVKCAAIEQPAVARALSDLGLEGTPAGTRVGRVIQDRRLDPDVDVVLQVARWDRLKDVPGVLAAYARHVAPASAAELVLAGPDPADVPDDPVGRTVFDEVVAAREALPAAVRARTHLVVLGLHDLAANAHVVNALQRRATVALQKSLEEGFGLAVTEAMWKRRAVAASAVGGIAEQIVDGVHGLLVQDPRDLAGVGAAVNRLLADAPVRARLAEAGHERVRERFLVTTELAEYARLYRQLAR